MHNGKIILIRTGGTIDAEPYSDPRNPPKYIAALSEKKSLIISVIRKLGYTVEEFHFGDVVTERRFVKDSKKFTRKDIQQLAEIIKSNKNRYFIVTHGTDAMRKNAYVLKNMLLGVDKIVIFVGSIVPLSMHGKKLKQERQIESDAFLFLSYSLEAIDSDILKKGVYLAGFDSRKRKIALLNPQKVVKNRAASLKELFLTFRRKASLSDDKP